MLLEPEQAVVASGFIPDEWQAVGQRKPPPINEGATTPALIEFSNIPVSETKEISENLYIDLDEKGNLVSMTIEHAKEKAGLSEVSFLQMENTRAL